LRSRVGVEDRASRLIELGLRWRGLRGGFAFGEDDELLRCRWALEGDEAWAE
jgi:hypothetical protein